VLAFAAAMFAAAIAHGMGTQRYPPQDGYMIPLPSGARVYYECAGFNATIAQNGPVVLLHGGSDQGIGHLLGVHDELAARGVRVCTWDKPGLGFSDYARVESVERPAVDLLAFVRQLPEREPNYTGPYLLVGVQRGGLDALRAARHAPDAFHSVLLVDTLLDGFRRRALTLGTGLDPGQALKIEQKLLEKELIGLKWVNRVAVPLGLSRLAAGPARITPEWREASAKERRWYEITDKTWVARKTRVLLDLEALAHAGSSANYTTSVPVHVLSSSWKDEAFRRSMCKRVNEEACLAILTAANELAAEEAASLAANGGQSVACNSNACQKLGLEQLLYFDPSGTADVIQRLADGEAASVA